MIKTIHYTKLGSSKSKEYRFLLKEVVNELFDSSPFRSVFTFKQLPNRIETESFNDSKNNKIKIIFHEYLTNQTYLIDFLVNNTSLPSQEDIPNYSVSDYSKLLLTVSKSVEQFINDFKPRIVIIEGVDSFDKVLKGKEGQKLKIYKYFISQIGNLDTYSIEKSTDNKTIILKKR